MEFDINKLVRPNIRNLKPYSSAREEYKGQDAVFLDANQNPYNAPYNRYPDPLQSALKNKIGELKNIPPENIFHGNGSDEAIDLLIRAFCEPGRDNIVSIDPSYGMYRVCADINDVQFTGVLLAEDFQVNVDAMLKAVNERTKIIMLCSPNNPTGNCFRETAITELIESFHGIVMLDEAYIDFAPEQSLLGKLKLYPNLVILQTLSKAWGMAGMRLGMAFAGEEIIRTLSKIKYPYNISKPVQEQVLTALEKPGQMKTWVERIQKEKSRLMRELEKIDLVEKVFPADANFFLIRVAEPRRIYEYLVKKNIIVRDRSGLRLCRGCLRITTGTEAENQALLDALKTYVS